MNYGKNKFDQASSETKIGATQADLSVSAPSDPVLDRIKRDGAKRTDTVNATPLRPSENMHNPNNPAEKVPSGVAWGEPVKPVRQPG